MEPAAATIAALATAPVAGGVGILRVSGAFALEVTRSLAPDVPAAPTPRHAYFTRFCDRSGAVVDEGLFLFFEAPRSFTGERVVELQAHGSPRLMELLLREVLRDDRVRMATPGEFTRRAFLSGRIDLTRAEAIADLVSAQSEAEVRAAAAQLHGSLASAVVTLKEPLLALRADLEGVLNFPEEAEGADVGAEARLSEVRAQAQQLLARAARGRFVRRAARVVLFGPANAGKSTLFNALLEEARALVDEVPGTTRDVLEAGLELDGLRVLLHDTAGLRDTAASRVEAMGVARAREVLRAADLALLVLPTDVPGEEEALWLREAGEVPVIRVESKCDLVGRAEGSPPTEVAAAEERSDSFSAAGRAVSEAQSFRERSESGHGSVSERSGSFSAAGRAVSEEQSFGERSESGLERTSSAAAESLGRLDTTAPGRSALAAAMNPGRVRHRVRVSGLLGEGVVSLRQLVRGALLESDAAGAVASLSERQVDVLRRVEFHLVEAEHASRSSTLEVVSGELGLALEALGELTGENASTQLLDAIFARFCIGK